MNKLPVPFILSSLGNIIHPSLSSTKEEYYCPTCFRELWSHKNNEDLNFYHANYSTCTKEIILMDTARLLIIKATLEKKINADNIQNLQGNEYRLVNFIADGIDNIQMDVEIDEKQVVDLCLYRKCKPILAIDFFVTGNVDSKTINNLTIPFVQLEANNVINYFSNKHQ